jgi:hypothetical protein
MNLNHESKEAYPGTRPYIEDRLRIAEEAIDNLNSGLIILNTRLQTIEKHFKKDKASENIQKD